MLLPNETIVESSLPSGDLAWGDDMHYILVVSIRPISDTEKRNVFHTSYSVNLVFIMYKKYVIIHAFA